jgi:23S rRNA pseudouridine1911/1915/1917 synthase
VLIMRMPFARIARVPACLSMEDLYESGRTQIRRTFARGSEVQILAINSGFDYRERVDGVGTPITVLEYLSGRYLHSTESVWRDRLGSGQVFLDGLPACETDILRSGQELVWRRPPWDEPDVPLSYAVLREDEHLLGVAKPSGLPTIPAGGFFEHTLLARVRLIYPHATPVHRLGRGTSGVVLFALSGLARSALGALFRRGEVVKTYRALASGHPERNAFTVDVPIGPVPHPRVGTIHAACPAGKRALSRVRILERRSSCSLVEVQIETGRPHQIRIHLAAAGHPLIGDPLYAAGGCFKADGSALPGDIGYWLHAERLEFRHPVRREQIEISCFPPPQLRSEC